MYFLEAYIFALHQTEERILYTMIELMITYMCATAILVVYGAQV